MMCFFFFFNKHFVEEIWIGVVSVFSYLRRKIPKYASEYILKRKKSSGVKYGYRTGQAINPYVCIMAPFNDIRTCFVGIVL